KEYELDMELYALNLTRFSWDAKEGVLSAFESDLRHTKFDGTYPWLRRIYNDACDVGIAIKSPKTGAMKRFYLEREETREGDILAWHFKPVDQCAVKSVVIF